MGDLFMTFAFAVVGLYMFFLKYILPFVIIAIGIILFIAVKKKRVIGIITLLIGVLYFLFTLLWEAGYLWFLPH